MVATSQSPGRRRLAIEVEVNMRFDAFPGRETALSANLSLGGMFIASPEPKPADTTIYLEFSLDHGLHTIKGVALVVWIRPKSSGIDEPSGMGVRFQALDEKGQEQILHHLEGHFPVETMPFGVKARQHGDDGVPAIPQESFEREMDLLNAPFNPATDLEAPDITLASGVIPIVPPPPPVSLTPLGWTPPPMPQPMRLGGAAAAKAERQSSPLFTALGLFLLVVAAMAAGGLLMERLRDLGDSDDGPSLAGRPAGGHGELTQIQSIEVDENAGTTLVVITADGPLRNRYSHIRLDARPHREVIRIAGIRDPFEPSILTPVDSLTIGRIHVALHPRQGASELHIALELAKPDVRVTRIQPRGNTLLVYLQ